MRFDKKAAKILSFFKILKQKSGFLLVEYSASAFILFIVVSVILSVFLFYFKLQRFEAENKNTFNLLLKAVNNPTNGYNEGSYTLYYNGQYQSCESSNAEYILVLSVEKIQADTTSVFDENSFFDIKTELYEIIGIIYKENISESTILHSLKTNKGVGVP